MVSEIWSSVERMETKDTKAMVRELKAKGPDLILEERIRLYFGLVKMNYLDNAMFQMQMIYNEIKEKGLSSDFVSRHPDLKIQLMSAFEIWEDACGNIHIDEVDDCGGWCCGCGGCLGVLLCISVCCGTEGLDCALSCIDPSTGCCCNLEDGGCCCNNCCTDCCCFAVEDGCGC